MSGNDPERKIWVSPNEEVEHSGSWLNPPTGTSGTERGLVLGGTVFPDAEAAERALGPLIGKNLHPERN